MDHSKIPETMKQARRWLVWRMQHGRKVPFYVSGVMRGKGIALDSELDIQQFASLDEALAALTGDNYSGLGFALGPDGSGGHWQGIDLDDVVAHGLEDLAASLPGYVESSPSGAGVHAIGYGDAFGALGSNGRGIEAYSKGRYFTVTGDALRGNICDLSSFIRDELAPRHSGGLLIEVTEFAEVTGFHSNHRMSQDVTAFTGKGEEHTACTENLPANCKPSASGTRNRVLFNLARHLKTKHPGSTSKDMLEIVKAWHAEHIHVVVTKDFATTWLDFRTAWEKVKYLEGEGRLHDIMNRVDPDTVPPVELARLGYEGPTWGCVQLCHHLAAESASSEFFLSSRTVESLLGISQRTASNLLRFMVDDGILVVENPSTRTKAATYKFVWPHPIFSKDDKDD